MTTRAKQGGYQDWAELRNHLIDRYGSTPHPATEQEIIDAYEIHPESVTHAALEILDLDNVTSPWGLLKARAAKIAAPPTNPTRSSSLEREKRIDRAEHYLRATLVHLDRTDEVLDDLFGEGGLLRPYAQVDLERTGPPDDNGLPTWKLSEVKGDDQLATRMLDLWAEHRHIGISIERDADHRAQAWKDNQKLMAEALAKTKAILDQRQPVPATTNDDDLPL